MQKNWIIKLLYIILYYLLYLIIDICDKYGNTSLILACINKLEKGSIKASWISKWM